MSDPRLPAARLVPVDLELLEQRARELAATEETAPRHDTLLQLVSFRVAGHPCAVDAGLLERAVSRLPAPVGVPTGGAGERAIAFVDEQPVPVADLAGAARGACRSASALEGAPALVLATRAGSVAVVVEGPLELCEQPMAALPAPGTAPEPSLESGLAARLQGALADGTNVLDPGWLAGWAAKVAAP